jgi:hypothetical protein
MSKREEREREREGKKEGKQGTGGGRAMTAAVLGDEQGRGRARQRDSRV